MACAGAFYYGESFRADTDLPYLIAEFERALFPPAGRKTIDRFHLRPIPDALLGWARYLDLYGLRHALSV